MAAGKWILHRSYLEACRSVGHFIQVRLCSCGCKRWLETYFMLIYTYFLCLCCRRMNMSGAVAPSLMLCPPSPPSKEDWHWLQCAGGKHCREAALSMRYLQKPWLPFYVRILLSSLSVLYFSGSFQWMGGHAEHRPQQRIRIQAPTSVGWSKGFSLFTQSFQKWNVVILIKDSDLVTEIRICWWELPTARHDQTQFLPVISRSRCCQVLPHLCTERPLICLQTSAGWSPETSELTCLRPLLKESHVWSQNTLQTTSCRSVDHHWVEWLKVIFCFCVNKYIKS